MNKSHSPPTDILTPHFPPQTLSFFHISFQSAFSLTFFQKKSYTTVSITAGTNPHGKIKAMEQELVEMQCIVRMAYEVGRRIEEDRVKAMGLYVKAEDQG